MLGATLVPATPLLLREVSGTADPVPDLREACAGALARLLAARPDVVHVVAADGPAVTPSSFAPAVADHGSSARPLGHLVADRLLSLAGWGGEVVRHLVADSMGRDSLVDLGRRVARAPREVAVLVVGGGSARRAPSAPGYVDPRARPFDSRAVEAVRAAHPDALRALDGTVARELLVDAWASWQVLAGVIDTVPLAADVLYADDPFGVLYVVAMLRRAERADRR